MSSTNSMNGHAPSESSISITSGNHSPSSSTPRSTFFDIIRQGFELFRDDYSNQYIEVSKIYYYYYYYFLNGLFLLLFKFMSYN